MCGIAGILDLRGEPVAQSEIDAMAASIAHRGPDDRGTFVRGPVGLASDRLAILDVSDAGHQPMTSEDGRYVLVYNGELYNFRELAPELEARGRSFRSRGDTEVVLRACEEWGPACARPLRRDVRVRDLGRSRADALPRPRPFRRQAALLRRAPAAGCSSAPRSRRCSRPACARASRPTRSREYFTFQNVFSDATLFDGVRMLPAGHLMRSSSSRTGEPERYWDLELEPDESVGESEWVERIRAAFEAAVERQLVSDVPLGSYLSGGMDSASIVAVGERAHPAADDVHRRVRPLVRERPRAGLRRARGRGARRERVPDRALRDGHARRGHGVGAPRARVAPRGPARRDVLPEPLHRPARLEVREGLARGDRRRRALRRLPVALRARRGRRRSRGVRQALLRVLEPARSRSAARRSSSRGASAARSRARRSTTTEPRSSRRARSTLSRRRSTSRRRRFSTGCSSSKTASRWRTASRFACRSSTTSS